MESHGAELAGITHGLSIRQPWAALLASGVKIVEVRTWSTKRRGRLWIHASKIPDERPEAWAWVNTPVLRQLAEFRGGVIGVGELCDCIRYDNPTSFVADRARHLNLPDWFVEKGMYGLAFRDVRTVPFFPCAGNTFFFPVEGFPT